MPLPATHFRVLSLAALCLVLTASFDAQSARINPDLVAHEWGTFTSIAGRDGNSVDRRLHPDRTPQTSLELTPAEMLHEAWEIAGSV